MGGKKRNGFDFFVFAEVMTFIGTIQCSRVVISMTPESAGWYSVRSVVIDSDNITSRLKTLLVLFL